MTRATHSSILTGLALLATTGCFGEIDGPQGGGDETLVAHTGPRHCNGHVELCDRSLADVAFATTHNSFSRDDVYTSGFSNQHFDMSRQLADGVRGFMLDTYWHKPLFRSARATLCHGNCTLGGYLDLVPELRRFRQFLDAEPDNVVLFLVEQHSLTPTQFAAAMKSAGLGTEVYTHASPTAPWPTLGQLIDAKQRIVVFYWTDGDEISPRPAWYHSLRAEVWETPYKYSSVDEFSCAQERGAPGAQLYMVDHFLSQPAGWASLAAKANPWNVILPRVQACEQVQLPNIVAVDYYDIDENEGDGVHSVVRAVDYLNGL